jgi:hypothetical protein
MLFILRFPSSLPIHKGTPKASVVNMYVHVEVLDARGSLVDLGSDPRDHIALHVGLASSRNTTPTPEQIVRSPILSQHTGIALPSALVPDLKHEITKRADKRRTLDKFLARLQVTKDGKWVGTVYVRLVCLANGYVVDRWVSMKQADGVEPGAVQLRIVMRETKEEALAVLSHQPQQNVEPNDLSRTEGCGCDVCDPNGEYNGEDAKRVRLATEVRDTLTVLAFCVISLKTDDDEAEVYYAQ